MTTITILTSYGTFTFDAAADWARDDDGDVHVYSEGDETVATFDSGAYVATFVGRDPERVVSASGRPIVD